MYQQANRYLFLNWKINESNWALNVWLSLKGSKEGPNPLPNLSSGCSEIWQYIIVISNFQIKISTEANEKSAKKQRKTTVSEVRHEKIKERAKLQCLPNAPQAAALALPQWCFWSLSSMYQVAEVRRLLASPWHPLRESARRLGV